MESLNRKDTKNAKEKTPRVPGISQDARSLTFAGLRYALAFVCLLSFAIRSRQLGSLRILPVGTWARLIALGLLLW